MLDYLVDLDADFRVFYRIDGIADEQFGDLSSERFFDLAIRTFAYRGVMRARMENELAEQQQEDGTTPAAPGAAAAGTGAQQPQQIGAGAEKKGVDPKQFVSQTHGADTIPDAVTYRQRLEMMGRK